MTLAIEYGSGRRGDYDATSDRDILILARTFAHGRKLYERFELVGCSVSFFSSNRSMHLISAGSLFFKHIFDEGELVSGDECDFLRLARAWRPAKDYQFEIDSTIDLLSLLEAVPRRRRAATIAVDIAVTSLRSILIRRLAAEGVYVFAWRTVVDQASRRGFVPKCASRLIAEARLIKNRYRQFGSTCASLAVADELVRVIRAAASSRCTMPEVRFTNSRRRVKPPEQLTDYSYKQLRAWEFVCAQHPRDPALFQLEQWSKRPNYFCALSASKRSRTIGLFY